jgi:hypothetical protein
MDAPEPLDDALHVLLARERDAYPKDRQTDDAWRRLELAAMARGIATAPVPPVPAPPEAAPPKAAPPEAAPPKAAPPEAAPPKAAPPEAAPPKAAPLEAAPPKAAPPAAVGKLLLTPAKGLALAAAIAIASGALGYQVGLGSRPTPPKTEFVAQHAAPAVEATAKPSPSEDPLNLADSAPLPVQASAGSPASAAPPTPSNTAPGPSNLASEQAHIDIARAALARGRPADALRSLGEHQRLYPSGKLREEREALAVQALAQSGQKAAATSRAERFRRVLDLRTCDYAAATPCATEVTNATPTATLTGVFLTAHKRVYAVRTVGGLSSLVQCASSAFVAGTCAWAPFGAPIPAGATYGTFDSDDDHLYAMVIPSSCSTGDTRCSEVVRIAK